MTDRSASAATDPAAPETNPWLPPRWFIRGAWAGHRAIHRFTAGRRGLAPPRADGQFGYLKLHTVGRRSGRARAAILGYVEDGANLVTLAMNGWGEGEPAWWLNLQTAPEATIELKGGTRAMRAHAATGEERDRLWRLIGSHKGWGTDIDAFARRRSGETAVVVFEPDR